MFDLGWAEIFVIAVVALIVIGPRDLPQTMRLVSSWFRKARSLTREFQTGIEAMAKEAELDEVKADIKAMVDYNPNAELMDTLDPGGKISASLPTQSDIYDDEDDADGKTDGLSAGMDIHDAMDDDHGNTDPDLVAPSSKEPDAVTAQAADGGDGTSAPEVPDADKPAATAGADGSTDDTKPAAGDAPVGTVMGPVPAKDKAQGRARP